MSINLDRIVVGHFQTNCYMVYDDEVKEAIITDPGDNAKFIIECAQSKGLKPVAIILTHAHEDHIMAVDDLRDFYDIPLYINDKDVPMFEDGKKNFSRKDFSLREKDIKLFGGEHLELGGMNIEVLHTPGHTPGGTCYFFPDEHFVLAGDTMFYRSWGRTDFPGGNKKDIMDSIWDKLLPLPEDTLVFPGHDRQTDIKSERIMHGYVEQ